MLLLQSNRKLDKEEVIYTINNTNNNTNNTNTNNKFMYIFFFVFLGDIQIFSADIVIDDNFYPHIVELNRTPYLKSSSGMFANLFPPMVTSWFKLSFKL